MTRLIKYLKPWAFWILAILLLLFGQAMADLSLPAYMSDIVNVGIQQNGIENAVPGALRPAQYDRLTLLMSPEDEAEVRAAYSLADESTLSPDEYAARVEEYPVLASTPLYLAPGYRQCAEGAPQPDLHAGHAGRGRDRAGRRRRAGRDGPARSGGRRPLRLHRRAARGAAGRPAERDRGADGRAAREHAHAVLRRLGEGRIRGPRAWTWAA